jgi:ribosome-associated heat shock protein Hsp15
MARAHKHFSAGEKEGVPTPVGQRLDLWIWYARFLRSRSACAELIRNGHVRINGRRVNTPGSTVRIGDVLTLALPGRTLLVRVETCAQRRGDAASTQGLFRPIEHKPGEPEAANGEYSFF